MATDQLSLAARNLTRHGKRTLISLLAITFGVVSLVVAGGFVEWILWATREGSIQTGLGHIQISRTGFKEEGFSEPSKFLLPADAPELARLKTARHVVAVDQRLRLTGLVSSGEITVGFTGEAVDVAANARINTFVSVTGKPLTDNDPDGVLLGRGLAQALGVKPGDRVTFLVTGPGGGIRAVEGRVRGLLVTGVKAYDDSTARMPIGLGRDLLGVQGSHQWVVGLSSTERTDASLSDLRALLKDKYEAHSWYELSDFYRKSVSLLSRQLNVVAAMIGVIIVLGISNALTMNVLERTGEIGTMMAIGAPRKKVMRLFFLEGLLLGVLGAAVGLSVGSLLAAVLSHFGIPMPPPPGRTEPYSAEIMLTMPIALSAVLLAVGSAILASIYPAIKASRLRIVDALRHNT